MESDDNLSVKEKINLIILIFMLFLAITAIYFYRRQGVDIFKNFYVKGIIYLYAIYGIYFLYTHRHPQEIDEKEAIRLLRRKTLKYEKKPERYFNQNKK